MKCDDCQELFSLYFDGEIDPVSRSEVDSHFTVCPECRMEWHAFRNTICFLREMPTANVPPDFIAGIHGKLESPSPWEKITEFFSGRNEKKWAYSTAVATLLIGVITASLTQLIPVTRTIPDSSAPATSHSEQATADISVAENTAPHVTQASRNNHGQTDFYPGVPLLSQYESNNPQTARQDTIASRSRAEENIPVVDFVSTGTGHTSSSYLDTPLKSFVTREQIPALKPDLQITIHSEPGTDDHMELVRRIVQSRLWRSELYDHNTLLLSVPAGNFDHLLQICGDRPTSLYPEYAGRSHYISLKRLVTVAIRID